MSDNLTGQVIGRITVLSPITVKNTNSDSPLAYTCRCECGEEFNAGTVALLNGTITQCGKCRARLKDYQLNLEDEHGLYGIGKCHNCDRLFYFDMEDFDKIKNYCWSSYGNNHDSHIKIETRVRYPDGSSKLVKMHQMIVGSMYDHIDRNSLNNRKYNLRPCTVRENNFNKSLRTDNSTGIIGVQPIYDGRWKACLTKDGTSYSLGHFDNKDDAIRARLIAEIKYFGEFAPQSHLYKQYGIDPVAIQSSLNDVIKSRRRGNFTYI